MPRLIKIIFLSLIISKFSSATIINIPADYDTIQHGINAAVDGDTVLVQPGTYNEEIDIIGKNIVVGSLFIITNDTSYILNTIIQGSEDQIYIVWFQNGVDSTCVLSGFTIRNGRPGIICSDSSPVISYCLITENTIYSHFLIGASGISCGRSSPLIKNCIIYNNEDIIDSGWAISAFNSNLKLVNTTIAWNPEVQGGLFLDESQAIIINCILWNNGSTSISVQSSPSPFIVYSNIEGRGQGEGNLNQDPNFNNPLNGDFTLSQDSPCIDAGTAFYKIDGDTVINLLEGQYNGLAPDMGAFESPYISSLPQKFNLPNKFKLYQNYPNPFNPLTKIKFALTQPDNVVIEICNTLGQPINTILNKHMTPGYHEIEFNAKNLTSGIYFYRIQTSDYKEVKKMVLVK